MGKFGKFEASLGNEASLPATFKSQRQGKCPSVGVKVLSIPKRLTCSVVSKAERTQALYKISLFHSRPPGVASSSDNSLLPCRTHDSGPTHPSQPGQLMTSFSRTAVLRNKHESCRLNTLVRGSPRTRMTADNVYTYIQGEWGRIESTRTPLITNSKLR